MQRRRVVRPSTLSTLRLLLTCAVGAIALVTLLALHVSPPHSASSGAFEGYKPPKVLSSRPRKQGEIGHQRWSAELKWTQELVPPTLSKLYSASQKVAGLRNWTSEEFEKLWKSPLNRDVVRCVAPSSSYSRPGESRGYLLVSTNGGLNQMRAGISDMVAVARLINATLVIPKLDKTSIWQDLSKFSDVFDEEYFIQSLMNDVKIVKKLPKELASSIKAVKYFTSWAGVEYYHEEIYPLWDDHQVIRAAKSDSRLANNNLPPDIQRLRCRAFFEALRFAPRIEAFGKSLVERMKTYGPYIALHLRYEKDMLAFSGCTYGLSPTEADELKSIRENISYWKVKDIDSFDQRVKGYCPLTPREVGIFLTALGYPPNTPIYIAAGEIYGGDSHMSELQARFPLLMTKETLASVDELEPFRAYAAQMAALDYIVSVESDAFIPSHSGNMARAVAGHRRFLGHRKTIIPDRKALVHLIDKLDHGSMKDGKRLSNMVLELHKRRQGSPRRRKGPISGTKGKERFRSEEAFYENPLPDCLCRQETPDWNS